MKSVTIMIFTFAFILLSQLKASPTPPPPPPPPPTLQIWNHILALSYGYGLHAVQSSRFKKPLPAQKPVFTLHGLWPNDAPPSPLLKLPKPTTSDKSIFCYKSSLSAAEIQSLRGELASKWPDLYDFGNSNADLEFWEREWVKHGTCTKFDKLQYFAKALALFDLLDLPSIVRFSGGSLAPDDHKIYYEKDVHQAFIKHQPYLICAGRKGNVVLTDLYFCLDNQANSFANCSTFYTSNNNNCDGGFKLLAK